MVPNLRLLLTSSNLKLKIGANFKYINSLLVKETHDETFWKKTSNIPVDNGSSLNVPITVKIMALTNITLIIK
jgi:hypothetical protein